MPQTTTQTIEAMAARKNDLILHKGAELQVVELSTKTKYTYIVVEDETGRQTLRMEADRAITVRRTEPTAEEREAAKRKMQNELHKNSARTAAENLAKARAMITERMEKDQAVDWSDLGDLISAQEKYKLWKEIEQIEANDEKADWVTAYERVQERCKENLLNNYMTGSSSDSFSNAIEGKKREAYSRIAVGYLW